MRKIVLTLFLSLFFIASAFAQDLESATNLYNSGATTLNENKKTDALKLFEEALEQAKTIGADADELATKCKDIIPNLILAIGKDQVAAKDIDNAIVTIKQAIARANEYGQTEVVAEGTDLIPQLYMAEGNSLLNAGDFAGAVAQYNKVIEASPENGMAYLRLGMASSRTEDDATTISAFEKAIQFGQEANAKKQLSTFYLKKAAAAIKAKKYAESYDFGMKSNEALSNPQALNLCGKAAVAQKKYKDAVEAFEGYLSLSPNAKDASATMYQLAVSLEALGQKDKACGYYKQIMTDPQFKEFATHKVNNELKCK